MNFAAAGQLVYEWGNTRLKTAIVAVEALLSGHFDTSLTTLGDQIEPEIHLLGDEPHVSFRKA